MEQVAQVNAILQERLGLDMLHPADKCHAFLVHNSDPVCGVLRAFPLLFPGGGNLVGHKLSSITFDLGSKHQLSLKNTDNVSNADVDVFENFHSRHHFHVGESFNGVI